MGHVALEQAASTGRLFLDNGQGYAGMALQWGPAQTLGWMWQEVNNPNDPQAEPESALSATDGETVPAGPHAGENDPAA